MNRGEQDPRAGQMRRWLARVLPGEPVRFEPASDDASFRRYFRIERPGTRSVILMDAPPSHEDCRPFVDIARRLQRAGVKVPKVLAQDLELGFLLLDDLGSTVYLDRLTPRSADTLYDAAIDTLVRMQAGTETRGLPPYDEARLRTEMSLFEQWFIARHLGRSLSTGERDGLGRIQDRLVEACLEQPRCFVHRDYHSRNLMILDDAPPGGEAGGPGVLDFQDAVLGPVSYDLVSLLRDVYIEWEPSRVDGWLQHYRRRASRAGLPGAPDPATARRWFDLTGVQRHLKIAGIFARLHYRDGKSRYLGDLPLTLGYLTQVSEAHEELRELARLLSALDATAASAEATRRELTRAAP